MATHNNTGKYGEALARRYFMDNGYEILHINWRHRHWEVDLIISKNNVLHFVEVKTKNSNEFGYPEESVNIKKIKNLLSAAEEYLMIYPQWQRIQFDILSVTLKPNLTFYFIEDVYL